MVKQSTTLLAVGRVIDDRPKFTHNASASELKGVGVCLEDPFTRNTIFV
jgi:hypothetical protein